MAKRPVELQDAKIPDKVDAAAIQARLKTDNFVSQFAREGKVLLAKTNQPNRITLDQFKPFIPVFNLDKPRYTEDRGYKQHIDALYLRYVKELEINLYEPTIVILSKEDPKELVVLNRLFTRINTDNVEGESLRDTVPAAISKVSGSTRDQAMLEASVADLANANRTPAQMDFFREVRRQTALITKAFVDRNMSPGARAELLAQNKLAEPAATNSPVAAPSNQGTIDTYLDDGDE